MNLTTALSRIENLIPTYRSPNLVGNGAWVLTHPSEVPEYLRVEQRDRNVAYTRTGDRNAPAYAPRYFVTSYGVLIAWVTLDGRTHYASAEDIHVATENVSVRRYRTVIGHRNSVRAAWPARFVTGVDGEVTSLPEITDHPFEPTPVDPANCALCDRPDHWHAVASRPDDICPQCERSDDCECEHGIY